MAQGYGELMDDPRYSVPQPGDAHVMVNEATTTDEAVYVCPVDGCGRRVVVNWFRPALTVIDQGDFWARHVGVSAGLELQVGVR
jgi:hypothetical protein